MVVVRREYLELDRLREDFRWQENNEEFGSAADTRWVVDYLFLIRAAPPGRLHNWRRARTSGWFWLTVCSPAYQRQPEWPEAKTSVNGYLLLTVFDERVVRRYIVDQLLKVSHDDWREASKELAEAFDALD